MCNEREKAERNFMLGLGFAGEGLGAQIWGFTFSQGGCRGLADLSKLY